jgi:hypothetical protein
MMCSTHKSIVSVSAILAAFALLCGGCQSDQGQPVGLQEKTLTLMGAGPARFDPVQPDPAPDAAARIRQWEPATSFYASGAATAYPTYKYDSNRLPHRWQQNGVEAVVDPFIFLGDCIAMPVEMFIAAPWMEIDYHGVYYPPTQTGSPPLPSVTPPHRPEVLEPATQPANQAE